MKPKYLRCFYLVMSLIFCPVTMLQAGDTESPDSQVVINRANELREILDHLLMDVNDSSIQKTIEGGDESIKALIEEAFRLKSEGEGLLSENKPMEAAISLQSALDHVFMAIRQEEGQPMSADALTVKLQDRIKVNDTFLEAATRVVTTRQNQDAIQLLDKAREARSRADSQSVNGDHEAALRALRNSTRLAQRAIMKIRDGQVIERRQ